MNKQKAEIAERKNELKKRLYEYRMIYLLMLPGIIFFIIMRYFPMVGLVMAFQNFTITRGIFGSEFVGFDNFSFFDSSFFWRALRNTFSIGLLRLAFSVPAALVLALLLNELRNLAFKKFVQTCSFLPFFLSWVVIATFTFGILSSDFGYLNTVIRQFGGEGRPWYLMPDIWQGILVGLNVWKNVGFGCIFYLAAIASINPEMYEAAYIDGAGRWKQFRYVTLPSLYSMIMIVLVLNVSFTLLADFEQIWSITGSHDILRDQTSVLSTAIFEIGLQRGFFGQASAMGLFNSIIMCSMLLGANFLARLLNKDYNLF